ncbi:DUF2254 family protein [Streptomyces sp. NPDC057291]|uniref:DUF2254 family protein n=1 Tax=Streptomyces sp. NPDC057291 TaxID=3346087 RepID=UPI00362ECB46
MAACVRFGPSRTVEQDAAYGFRLLADIAIRALSPAVNDPTTAVQALDQIEDALLCLSDRPLGPAWLVDRRGRVVLAEEAGLLLDAREKAPDLGFHLPGAFHSARSRPSPACMLTPISSHCCTPPDQCFRTSHGRNPRFSPRVRHLG